MASDTEAIKRTASFMASGDPRGDEAKLNGKNIGSLTSLSERIDSLYTRNSRPSFGSDAGSIKRSKTRTWLHGGHGQS